MRAILKWLFILAATLAIPAAAFGQTTSVTATVVDPHGVPYAGATVVARVSNPAATVTNNNQNQCISAGLSSAPCQMPIAGTVGPAPLDPTGSFNLTLYDNNQIQPSGTQWAFTIGIAPGVLPPWGTGPQSFTVSITITGASQDISSTLSAAALALTQPFTPGGGITGTIAVPEVAFATAPNTIGGDPNFTYAQTGLGFIGFSLTPNATGTLINIVNNGPIDARGIPGVIIQDRTQGGIYLISEGGNNVGGDFGIEIENMGSGPGDGGTLILDEGTGGMQITEAGGSSGAAMTISNTGTGIIDVETSTAAIDLNLTSGHPVNAGPLVTTGTDGTTAGLFRSANGAAAAHTDWGSDATTSNEVDGPPTVATNGHFVSWTVSGTKGQLTDSGVGTGGVVTTVTASPPIVSSGGATPNITCPTCTTPSSTTAITTALFTSTSASQAAIPGLSFPLAANTSYGISCHLVWFTTGGLTSMSYSSTGPAAPTQVTAQTLMALSAGTGATFNAAAADGTTFGFTLDAGVTSNTGTDFYSDIDIGIINGANAGTFQLTANNPGAVNTVNIRPGSFCKM